MTTANQIRKLKAIVDAFYAETDELIPPGPDKQAHIKAMHEAHFHAVTALQREQMHQAVR